MAGPSWLAGTFAAVMIVIAAYSASRLAISRLRRRATEFDADALHAVMGAAMAGMLVPRLSVLPGSAWAAVFGIAAAWFGWHAIRARGAGTPGGARCRYPVPHLIECVAMLYMLLPRARPAARARGTAMAMPGMGASAGPGSFPALAVVLALFMLGYVVWTTDQLTTLARAKTTATGPGSNPGHQPPGSRQRTATPPARQPPPDPAPRSGRQANARPQARRLRQDRDEHHHGLHAHPHALTPLSGEPADRHARPRHRQQHGQASPPTAPEFTDIFFGSRPYMGDLHARRFARRRCATRA